MLPPLPVSGSAAAPARCLTVRCQVARSRQASTEQLTRLQKVQVAAAAAGASGSGTASAATASRPQLLPARTAAATSAGAIVSVASLNAAQLQVAQRFVSGGLVAASPGAKSTALAASIPIQTLAQKHLTPGQLQVLKQQTLLRQKLTLDPLKRLQVATTAAAAVSAPASVQPQKLQVAVTSLGSVAGVAAAVPVSQPAATQARTQVRILKQAAGKQMVAARTMTESEMAAILKQKPAPLQPVAQTQLVPQLLAQVQGAAAARAGASPPVSAVAGTATQTLTIPVTAISVAGVSLPQMRAANAAKVSSAQLRLCSL